MLYEARIGQLVCSPDITSIEQVVSQLFKHVLQIVEKSQFSGWGICYLSHNQFLVFLLILSLYLKINLYHQISINFLVYITSLYLGTWDCNFSQLQSIYSVPCFWHCFHVYNYGYILLGLSTKFRQLKTYLCSAFKVIIIIQYRIVPRFVQYAKKKLAGVYFQFKLAPLPRRAIYIFTVLIVGISIFLQLNDILFHFSVITKIHLTSACRMKVHQFISL